MLRLVRIAVLLILTSGIVFSTIMPQAASAFSGSDFKAGRITDDAIFFSSPNINIAGIQNFLNAKVPNCDTWGTQPYGGTTRAAYAASRGVSTPFTCLRDYWQKTPNRPAETGLCNGYTGGNHSAAGIIYWVAESCGINPRVLLTLLQKEQSLITDEWPWPIQYRSATGYGCPDTAPCDAEYYGFFNQVYAAARQFKRYARDTNSFNYRATLHNNIQYHPNAGCGSSSVFIENQATAGLYNYTPYQPNAAALANLYGTGDGCSSYGNRNYWRMYYDWFGSPTNNAYSWEVIKEPGVNKLYLVNNRTRHWIPGPSVNAAWGLDEYSYREVDSTYFNSLSIGATLSYVGLDVNGARYLMNGGKKFLLPNDQYVLLWNVAGVPHISAPGYIAQTISGGSVGRFATVDESTIYLVNGEQKHLGSNAQSLSKWGYSSSKLTTVSQDILDRFTNGPSVDRYVSVGDKKYSLDTNKVYQYSRSAIEHAWGNRTYTPISRYALDVLPKANAGLFVRAEGDSKWYFLESGKKHYVPTPHHAKIWGWGDRNPLIVVSPDMLNQFTTGSSLGYFAESALSGNTYLINGTRHLISDENVLNNIRGDSSVPVFSSQSLSDLPGGSNISTNNFGFHGFNTIYVFDGGTLRGIPNPTVLDAIGGNRNHKFITLTNALGNVITKTSGINYVVKDSEGSGYYLENGYKSSIDPAFASTWKLDTAPTVSDTFLSTLDDNNKTLGLGINYGGKRYLVNNRSLLEVTGDYTNLSQSSNDFESISRSYMSRHSSSHLVGTPTSNKIWLLASGKRYHIPSYSMLLDLGYGTHSGIVSLNQDIIDTIPESEEFAYRVVKSPDSGAVFTSHGRGYGFWNYAILKAHLSNSQKPLVIPNSAFNKFGFYGWAELIVYGSNGKVYLIEDGTKRWITNPDILYSRYGHFKWRQYPQFTIDSFPNGTNASN